MIHNILGEDAKIFDLGAEPKPAELVKNYPNLQESIKDLPHALRYQNADYQSNGIKALPYSPKFWRYYEILKGIANIMNRLSHAVLQPKHTGKKPPSFSKTNSMREFST